MMSDLALVFDGNLNSDGTIQLDRPPGISPGRVQVTLRRYLPLNRVTLRIPDGPWPDEAVSAPFDLPRPGIPERVRPRRACDRLPDSWRPKRRTWHDVRVSSWDRIFIARGHSRRVSLVGLEMATSSTGLEPVATTIRVRTLVLTQACDLALEKTTRVLVAVVHSARNLVERGVVTAKTVREQIRTHRVYGWYFLPKGSAAEESIVDLRDLHTIPRSMLEKLVCDGNRICRIRTPYREHLAQHFSITYARIGLPEPYETQAE